jgi:hypothetical protein
MHTQNRFPESDSASSAFLRARKGAHRYDSRKLWCQIPSDVDQVIGDHAQSDPPPHAMQSVIARACQSVAPLDPH